MRTRLIPSPLALVVGMIACGSLAAAAAVSLHAAERGRRDRGFSCDDDDSGWRRNAHCEIRELTLPLGSGPIRVDARPNGGIHVIGGGRGEIQLKAKVQAHADSSSAARAIVGEVQIDTSGTIQAEGPASVRNRSWSVSYQLVVPTESDLQLESTNGGISIDSVSGDLELRTTNGGIHLDAVAGNVRGRTTNGGLHVELEGSEWKGEALDVETQNGGVHLTLPSGYNAHLETATVNGGMQIDFPVTVRGKLGRQLSIDLGNGGRTVRAVTTNGGVVINRR